MIRTTDNDVILEPAEAEVKDLVLQILEEDTSLSYPEAARHALSVLPHPDPQFVAWVLDEPAD